jgi:hypothetical protein
MALQCKLQLVVSDDARQVSVDELVRPGTRTLNGDLAATFRRWYPAFSLEDQLAGGNLLAA